MLDRDQQALIQRMKTCLLITQGEMGHIHEKFNIFPISIDKN